MFTTGWAGREGDLLAELRTYLPLSRTTLTQQFLVRAPNFGDPAQRHRQFCASSSRAVRGNTAEVALRRPVVSAMALVMARRRHLAIG